MGCFKNSQAIVYGEYYLVEAEGMKLHYSALYKEIDAVIAIVSLLMPHLSILNLWDYKSV